MAGKSLPLVWSVVLTLLPIAAILVLMAWKQVAADISGMAGWLLTLVIAFLFFKTSLDVGLRSSLAGLISSFPVSLMVATSIFQITFMEASGALRRVSVFVKTLSPGDQAVQLMLIGVGAGTLLVAVGATPVSILPPILLALGYSSFAAVALPALGFDALCTFSLLGAPLVVYSDLTGTPLVQAAQVFARFLPLVSLLVGFSVLWVAGGFRLVRQGSIPCIIAGVTNGGVAVAMSYLPGLKGGVVLIGVVAGICTFLVMLLYLKIRGKPIIDRSGLSPEELAIERELSLGAALSPWIILIALSFIVNFYPPFFRLLFENLAMPVSVIPGQVIYTRMLWNAYTWVLISTVLAFAFLKPTGRAIRHTLAWWLRRAPRPVLSAAVFFAIAFVMNNSGMQNVGGVWKIADQGSNMIWVLARGSALVFGSCYPFVSAFTGLFGGLISGSEASTIAMFTKYHLLTSRMLGVDPLAVTAATAVGGGLASVISPAKLQNAAATIDALGIESRVIRTAFLVSVLLTVAAGLIALVVT